MFKKNSTIVGYFFLVVCGFALGAGIYLRAEYLLSARLQSHDSMRSATDTYSPWQTYVDKEFGFKVSYPDDWFQSLHGSSLVLGATGPAERNAPTISITALEQYHDQPLEDIFNGTLEDKIDFKNDCATTVFAGSTGYDCVGSPNPSRNTIFFYKNNIPFVIYDDILTDESRRIISTFMFLSGEAGE